MWLNIAYIIAIFIPALTVSVRRLHDINKSGWWLLINLIPLVEGLIFFFLLIKDSRPGNNQYGPNPKGQEAGPTQTTPTNSEPPTPIEA